MDYRNISVTIPAFNEEENIMDIVSRTIAALPNAEIIVVDDNSQDRTYSIAEGIGYKRLKVIRNQKSLGKGGAVREAIAAAQEGVMAQIDADLQFIPEEIPQLIRPILEDKADIVFGSRYKRGAEIEKGSVSLIKRLSSYFMSLLVSIICLRRYTDVFAGMKAWKSGAIKDINLKINNFGYEAEIAIVSRKKGYKIVEVPISYKKRLKGESKIKFIRDIFVIPWAIIKVMFLHRD